MRGKPKKAPREKDLTSRYFSGGYDEDRAEQSETFSARNKNLQKDKMAKTAQLRAEGATGVDVSTLPIGEVVQVHSLYSQVQSQGKTYLCVVRRTLTKLAHTFVVVGDLVRFRDGTIRDAAGKDVSGNEMGDIGSGAEFAAGTTPEAVIEEILPRKTVLTRSDSFKGITQHPIIANAEQVLIVASIRQPYAKWGLIDRMLIAAEAGGLRPIVCLNKLDLALSDEVQPPPDLEEAEAVLTHYASLGVRVLRTSVKLEMGISELRDVFTNHITVLAGHSGVGKSSLVRAVDPKLDLKVGEVSRYTDKGRHTTTSARRYPLESGGAVVDTPGVKQFGLWKVTRENLPNFFPDVAAGNAPPWRQKSYQRILDGLPPDVAPPRPH